MNFKNKIFLFPLSLAVILFSSIIIIFSPLGQKNIINPSSLPWQTYTSSLDNYEISYPSSWQIIDNLPGELTLEKPNYARISIDSSNQRGFTLPIKAWINKTNTKLENDPNRFPATTTIQIIDNDDVLKNIPDLVTVNASFFGQDGKQYIFPHLKKIFSITGIYFIDDSMAEEQIVSISSEINKILSTFKFLPNTSSYKISSKDALEKISKLSEIVAETKCQDRPGSKAIVRVAVEANDEDPNYQIYFEETHPNDIKLLAVFFVNANTGLITTQDNDKIISYQQWRETHQTKGCNFKPLSCGDISGFECPQGYSCSISETEYGRVCFLI